jgi:hypothetical protein
VAANPVTPKATKPISICDRVRAETNYAPKRFTGFVPIPHAAVVEMNRLASGFACLKLLYFIMDRALGQVVKENQPFMETTSELSTAELVGATFCDERTIQREMLGLAQRKVISYTQRKKGTWRITPLFREWASLPDYKPGPTPEPVPDDDEPEQPDEAAKVQTVVKLTDKPVPVRAGGASRKIKVETGISEVWCKSNLDIHFEAVIQGGSLLVNFIGPQFRAASGNGLLKSKEIQAGNRHPRRVEHTRAEELRKLFDELIVHGSLEGDPVCLAEACEAIGVTPHDHLLHFVMVRSEREIKSPKAAVCICRDAAKDWERSKNLPARKPPEKIVIPKTVPYDPAGIKAKYGR